MSLLRFVRCDLNGEPESSDRGMGIPRLPPRSYREKGMVSPNQVDVANWESAKLIEPPYADGLRYLIDGFSWWMLPGGVVSYGVSTGWANDSTQVPPLAIGCEIYSLYPSSMTRIMIFLRN